MYDSHIHSEFSEDSHMKAADACEKAVNLGLDGIVFTDHIDFKCPDYDHDTLIDFEQFFRCLGSLQKFWKGKLDILLGIEIGYQPHKISDINEMINNNTFDFIINSVHIIEQMDPYTGGYFKDRTQHQAYERYLQEILYSINDLDNFDIIGHIGYVARYGSFEDKHLKYQDYSDLLDQILKAVIEKGKGIEINTSGIRSDLKCPIPDYDVFRRYYDLGGEIVTIGSDSHFPEHIGHSFKEALEYLENIGFKYVAHYEGRKPVFEKL